MDKPDHFTDQAAKQFKDRPGAKYDVVRDWTRPEMFASSVGRLRGRFNPEGKGIKQYRMSEQIMYDEKKENRPDPGKYPPEQLFEKMPKYAAKGDK